MQAIIVQLKDVVAVDEFVYNALCQYYNVLSKTGYYKYSDVKKLLVLLFITDMVNGDYRGEISEADYHVIEKALNCLYGTSCLIPYPDYKSMTRLHLGEVSEMAQRLKNLENTKVVKGKETVKIVDDIDIE
jgi:hypothetical protein